MEQILKNNGLNNLIVKLKDDKSLMQKFYDLENPTIDDLYTIALSISNGYSKEEFVNFLKYIKDRDSDNIVKILNDSDLDKVSGGRADPEKVLTTTTSIIELLYPLAKIIAH